MITGVHHVALICSDIDRSIAFYCEVLGFKLLSKHYREERKSWKVDLALNGHYILELFTFPDAPRRNSWPEAMGLRHIAFSVLDIKSLHAEIRSKWNDVQEIRLDSYTNKFFFFLNDPDNQPIEFYAID